MLTKSQKTGKITKKKRAKNGQFFQNARLNGHARFKTGDFFTLVHQVCHPRNPLTQLDGYSEFPISERGQKILLRRKARLPQGLSCARYTNLYPIAGNIIHRKHAYVPSSWT